MKSKLFAELIKTAQTSAGRWVRILPDKGKGYQLYDALGEAWIGCILVDADGNWIYDGEALSLTEQEELAGKITGNRREMAQLLSSLNIR